MLAEHNRASLLCSPACHSHAGGLQGIGDDTESVVSSSATIAESEAGYLPVFFDPRPLLNLQLTDQMPSLCPITDMKVGHLLAGDALSKAAAVLAQTSVAGGQPAGRGDPADLLPVRQGLAQLPARAQAWPGCG